MKPSRSSRLVLITGLASVALSVAGCPLKSQVEVSTNPPAPPLEDTGDTGDTGAEDGDAAAG